MSTENKSKMLPVDDISDLVSEIILTETEKTVFRDAHGRFIPEGTPYRTTTYTSTSTSSGPIGYKYDSSINSWIPV